MQRRKLLGGSAACSPFGNFLDFNSLKSWVSESFRKDIGTISPWKVLFLVKHIISFFKNLTDFGGNLCGSKPACICLIVVFQYHFTLFCIDLHCLSSVHLFPFTSCRSLEIKFSLLDNYSAQRLRLQYRSTVLSKMFYDDNDYTIRFHVQPQKWEKHTSEFLVDFDTGGEIHPLTVTMLLYPTAVWFLLTVSPFDRELVLM